MAIIVKNGKDDSVIKKKNEERRSKFKYENTNKIKIIEESNR